MDDLGLARAAAVALEQECAALADTLKLLTHEYEPAGASNRLDCRCGRRVDDTVHRTPDRLRKHYGFGP